MKAFYRLTAIFFTLLIINAAYAKGPEVGDIPPNYVGRDTDNKKLDLKEMRGKVVVLSFWASWCAPCRKEIPILDSIQAQVGKDHLEVIAINYGEDRRFYKRLVSKMKNAHLTFSHDRRLAVSRRYGIDSLPNLFIINREGTVAFHHVGYDERMLPQLVSEINSVLNPKE